MNASKWFARRVRRLMFVAVGIVACGAASLASLAAPTPT